MKKIKWIAVVCVLAVIVVWGVQHRTVSTPDTVLKNARIGFYSGEASALLLIAQKEGFYKRHGLKIDLIPYPTGRDAMKGLLDGDVDYANCTEFVAVKNSFYRTDFKILASITEGDINGILAKKANGVLTPADFKGKNIGTTIGTLTEYLTGVFLDQHQLSLNDVNIVHVEPEKRYEAIEDPNIDALFAWEPHLYNLRKKYPVALNYFPMPKGFPFYFILAVDETFHKNNKETSVNILKALHDTEQWIHNHPEKLEAYLLAFFKGPKAYTQYSITRHNFEISFPYILPRIMNNQAQWLITNGIVKRQTIPDFFLLFDTNPLKETKPESITIIE